MYRLCYISTSRSPVTPSECEQILQVSRRNNERDGITGLLIGGRQRFLQALEGEKERVRAAFERIKQDPRHFACVLIEEREVGERQFPLWSMGYEQSDEGAAGLSHAQYAATLIGQIKNPDLRAQFEGFLTLQWKASRAA